MSRATRRDLLGAGTAAALAGLATAAAARPGIALPPASPDAPLLALCSRFMELQAQIDASYARETERHRALKRQGAAYAQLHVSEAEREAECAPLEDQQLVLLDQLGGLVASTQEGQRARARVLMAFYSLGGGKGGEHTLVVEWSRLAPLFRDLLGISV